MSKTGRPATVSIKFIKKIESGTEQEEAGEGQGGRLHGQSAATRLGTTVLGKLFIINFSFS